MLYNCSFTKTGTIEADSEESAQEQFAELIADDIESDDVSVCEVEEDEEKEVLK